MPRTPKSPSVNIMQRVTSRDFKGGLDLADSELNLSSKYSRQAKNLICGIDGSLEVRQGCALFCDLAPISSYPLVNIDYFFTYVMTINQAGELFAINGAGSAMRIWDRTLAAQKVPSRNMWGLTQHAAFLEFNGSLIVGNGIDKPLTIGTNLNVDYLNDLPTGSNVNVPIGAIMESFSNHLCIAEGYTLHVSERNAAGSWAGDIGVQFTGTFDMRPYVTTGDPTIIGLLNFRGYLLVMFREMMVPISFVEDSTKSPPLQIVTNPQNQIQTYGSVSQRALQNIGTFGLACDTVGVTSVTLSPFTSILSPDRPSRLVDPSLQVDLNELDLTSLRDGVFSVFDRRLGVYMIGVPTNPGPDQRGIKFYCYRYIDSLKIASWTTHEDWNFNCGTRSSEGNLFFARANSNKIFLKGDAKTNPLFADYIGEQETFSDKTVFTDGHGLTPITSVATSGVPINWVWELPWTDLKDRAITKTLRYVIFDTEGDQQFQAQVFIDDQFIARNFGELFTDHTAFTDGMAWTPNGHPPYTPAAQLQWIGRDAGGFGNSPYGSSPYGGGNNTSMRSLSLMPTKFTTAKFRFSGSSMGPLKFVSITLLYQKGTIRRMP